MKKNLFSIGLAFSVILGVAFSFLPQEVGAYVRMGELEDGGEGSCANQPDQNDGDCTYATSESGTNTYFCENSWIFHDCVK